MSLSCSILLIFQSLVARDISFILLISVSNFCNQLNNIFTHSGNFNPYEKTSSVSNTMESLGFPSRGFLREASSSIIAAQLSLFSFKKFGDIHHCQLTQKDKN